ncbi:hypothetical protein Sste5346_008031 [Sporothrix stenoceras]|uniref:Transcription factor domain-containing protein n=1 Tax=Sporothrix stenoceras TaxID=5173 RepID=A0ABR3YRB3_9PEZI
MAHILKIWDMNEGDDGVTREIKRRIWWTCFIIDTWGSGGIGLSRQFGWRLKMPQVPMDEAVFAEMRPGDPDIDNATWKPGLWGHMVRLVEIYGQIQDFLRHLAESVDWDEDVINDTVRDLDTQMADFELNIGPAVVFSPENLARYLAHGLGSVFVAFHLGYHHYYTLLFYVYLDSRRPPTANGKAYARRCKHHAKTICEVLRASRVNPGAEALYNIVGHVTIVSSSVLLHTYLFGEADELPHSRSCLESNLETLVQLRACWANIDLMVS